MLVSPTANAVLRMPLLLAPVALPRAQAPSSNPAALAELFEPRATASPPKVEFACAVPNCKSCRPLNDTLTSSPVKDSAWAATLTAAIELLALAESVCSTPCHGTSSAATVETPAW
ncbi:hypothetical protein LAUMK35_01618 [Mycobacterium pseudokansasii]|nr:hypothetical protein LAUMK35_01618 [Mycobacterium pseudokansasii]VAZ92383.1 hypothetical protein LAUMK21_01617 [Mycobacterium pseudokansasii]